MTSVEQRNIEQLTASAATEGKILLKQYRAIEGDLRVILLSTRGEQERWSVSSPNGPYKM